MSASPEAKSVLARFGEARPDGIVDSSPPRCRRAAREGPPSPTPARDGWSQPVNVQEIGICLKIGTVPKTGRSRLGDSEVRNQYRRLYEANYGLIYSFVMRRLPDDRDSIEDVVAEVFAVAWNKRGTIPPPPEDRYWLLAVAEKSVLRQKRNLQRRGRLLDRVRIEARADHSSGLYNSVEGTVADVQQVRKAIESLPPREAEVLRLLHWEHLSTTEAAQVLGCSPNTVSIRAHRARKRLRSLLEIDERRAGQSLPAEEMQ